MTGSYEPRWKQAYDQFRSDSPTGVWLVQGPSGLGKTALVENWAAYAASRGDTPFLIRLSGSEAIEEKVRSSMIHFGGFPAEAPELWEGGGFIFFLDGLNEDLHPDDTLTFVRRNAAPNLFVITSQWKPDWPELTLKRISLHEFGRKQLDVILPDEVVEQVLLDERLRGWARLHQTAKLLGRYYEQHGHLPRVHLDLYRELRSELENEEFARALEEIAWELFKKREFMFEGLSVWPIPLLERAVEVKILVRQAAGEEIKYRFAHERVSRFFNAAYLVRQDHKRLEEWHAEVRPGVGREYWAETLEFWAEMLVEPEDAEGTSGKAYLSFLEDVAEFHLPTFRRLYRQALHLERAQLVQLGNAFTQFAAERMAED